MVSSRTRLTIKNLVDSKQAFHAVIWMAGSHHFIPHLQQKAAFSMVYSGIASFHVMDALRWVAAVKPVTGLPVLKASNNFSEILHEDIYVHHVHTYLWCSYHVLNFFETKCNHKSEQSVLYFVVFYVYIYVYACNMKYNTRTQYILVHIVHVSHHQSISLIFMVHKIILYIIFVPYPHKFSSNE